MKPYFLPAFGAGVFLMACQPDLGTSAATGGAANADGGSAPVSYGSGSAQSNGGAVGEGGIANNNTTWLFGGFGGGGASNLGGGGNDVIPRVCTPGSTEPCVCAGGFLGEQTCNSTGYGFEMCICTPVCGNGWLETGEACDDGNLVDDDGCQANCQLPG